MRGEGTGGVCTGPPCAGDVSMSLRRLATATTQGVLEADVRAVVHGTDAKASL